MSGIFDRSLARLRGPPCVAAARSRTTAQRRLRADANVEALLGIGQVQIEQARFAAGILLPAVDGVESDAYKEYDQDELEEMTRAQGRDSNAKLREVLAKVRASSAPTRLPSTLLGKARAADSLAGISCVATQLPGAPAPAISAALVGPSNSRGQLRG